MCRAERTWLEIMVSIQASMSTREKTGDAPSVGSFLAAQENHVVDCHIAGCNTACKYTARQNHTTYVEVDVDVMAMETTL